MAKPTLQQVCDLSRALLGDDQVAGGEIFTDQILGPHILSALRELFRALRGAQDPFVLQQAYFNLPANTSVLDPATAGILDLAEPEFVEVRPVGSVSVAITNVVQTGSQAAVTAVGHGLVTGQIVVIYGVQGFDPFNTPNGLWSISVPDVNTINLLGCTATGSYVSGGVVTTGIGAFAPMFPKDLLDTADLQSSGASPAALYVWQGGVFKFVPSSQAQQIKITYRLSGVLPVSPATLIPIEDSQDFIATRAAGLAAASKGSDRAGQLKADALGPTGEADGSGGLLRQLIVIDVRNMQRNMYRRGSFRQRRNRAESQI